MKNISFGSNLKNLRKKSGYTRKSFSEMLSYSEKAVEKWESGDSIPPINTLCQIAEIFGITLDALIYSQKNEIKYLLGIDGGGTKTELLLTDLHGKEIKRIFLSNSNPVDIGMDNCKAILEKGILQIINGKNPGEISMFAGLAGGISGDNKKILEKFFSRFGFGAYSNGSDTDNALEIALKGDDGMMIIMGTGIISFAQKNGNKKRIGGWGYLLDSSGSGYNIGRDALEAALRTIDGRGAKTILLPMIEEKLNKSLPEAIPEIYIGSKKYIAEFAQLVFAAYEQKDAVADEILERNLKGIAEIINVGKEFLESDVAKVVLCGGISKQKQHINEIFNKLSINAMIEYLEEPIVNGAILLARKEIENAEN